MRPMAFLRQGPGEGGRTSALTLVWPVPRAEARSPAHGSYDVEVVPSITSIPAEVWQQMVPPDDPVWHWSYFLTMEQHSVGPDGMAYVVLKSQGRIAGVAPIFWYESLRLDLAMGEKWKARTHWLRRLLPGLFRTPALFCGHPLGEGHLLLAPWAHADAGRALTAAVYRLARRRPGMIVFKDFDSRYHSALQDGGKRGSSFQVPALPDTVLDLPYTCFEEYLGSLKLKARRNARSKIRKFESTPGMRVEVVSDFAPLVPELSRLYEQVYERAEIKLDHLSPSFLSALARDESTSKRVILCWHGERLMGFALCLLLGNRCVNLRMGQDYEGARESRSYFMLHYETIRLALEQGCSEVRFCPTSYHAKLELGCGLLPLHHFISHTNPLRRWMLRLTMPAMLSDFRHVELVKANMDERAPTPG